MTKIKGHDRYEVRRVGEGPGPRLTTSAADFMKPWTNFGDETEDDEKINEEDVQDDEVDQGEDLEQEANEGDR